MLKPDHYFTEKAKGTIRAELELDADGKPEIISNGGIKHYKVRLNFDSANPEIRKVVYRLDPTYYDPIRETREKEKKFELKTTTYGDYQVVVDVQLGDEVVREKALLSDLLKETHSKSVNAAVQKALKEIADH